MLNRRQFLRGAGLAGLGAAVSPVWRALAAGEAAWSGSALAWQGNFPLGRVLLNGLSAYSEPSWHSPVNDFVYYNDIVNVEGAVEGEGLYFNNNIYIKTELGYLYSSFVQPVRYELNGAVGDVGGGFWAELTVPISEARYAPDPAAGRHSIMHFSSMHRVTGVVPGADGQPWYQISEEWTSHFMPAAHLRPVWPEQVSPISTHVPPEAKRIEVRISNQMLTAFEGDAPVLTTLCSTGVPGWHTPFGNYPVLDKRLGTRMAGAASDAFWNLPGVPYASYITYSWVAIHGTYWHNDYGRRRSHGCINVTPEIAQWLFRWMTPYADYNAFRTRTADTEMPGTVVNVDW